MAPRARKPPKPKSTPTRKQANAFDKAHQALRDSYDIEKPQGWKDILSSLDDGKQLLDKILMARDVSYDDAREYEKWVKENLQARDEDEDEEDDWQPKHPSTINGTAPGGLAANYHREAISIIFNELLLSAIEACANASPPRPATQPPLEEDSPRGECERVASVIQALIASVQTIKSDSKAAPAELHTPEWLDLLKLVLQAVVNSHIGGPDIPSDVSSLLELIATDDKNKKGVDILRKNTADFATLGKLLASSSIALMSLNLLRIIDAIAVNATTLMGIFGGYWTKEVVQKTIKLFTELKSDPKTRRSKYILLMELINNIAKDDVSLSPRGFQITGLRVDGSNFIDGKRPKQRLENGSTIAYVDQWNITAVLFQESGVEDPSTFGISRIVKFTQKDVGAFSIDIKRTESPDTIVHVELGIQPSQAADFEARVLEALKLSGVVINRPESPDLYDDGASLSDEVIELLEQARRDLGSSVNDSNPLSSAPNPSFVVNGVEEDTADRPQREAHEKEAPQPAAHQKEDAAAGDLTTNDAYKTPDPTTPSPDTSSSPTSASTVPAAKPSASKKAHGFRAPVPVAGKSLPQADTPSNSKSTKAKTSNKKAPVQNGATDHDNVVLVEETPTDPVTASASKKPAKKQTSKAAKQAAQTAEEGSIAGEDATAPSPVSPATRPSRAAPTLTTAHQKKPAPQNEATADGETPATPDQPSTRTRPTRGAGKAAANRAKQVAPEEKEDQAEEEESAQPDTLKTPSRASRSRGKATAQKTKTDSNDDEKDANENTSAEPVVFPTSRTRPSRAAGKAAAEKAKKAAEEEEESLTEEESPPQPVPAASRRAADKTAADKTKKSSRTEETSPATEEPQPQADPSTRSRPSRAYGKAAASRGKPAAQDEDGASTQRKDPSPPPQRTNKKPTKTAKTAEPPVGEEDASRTDGNAQSPPPQSVRPSSPGEVEDVDVSRSRPQAGRSRVRPAKEKVANSAQEPIEIDDDQASKDASPVPRQAPSPARSSSLDSLASRLAKEAAAPPQPTAKGTTPREPVSPSDAPVEHLTDSPSAGNATAVLSSQDFSPPDPPKAPTPIPSSPVTRKPLLAMPVAAPQPTVRRSRSAAMRGKEDPPPKKDPTFRTPLQTTEAQNVAPRKPRPSNVLPDSPNVPLVPPMPQKKGRPSNAGRSTMHANDQPSPPPTSDLKPQNQKQPVKESTKRKHDEVVTVSDGSDVEDAPLPWVNKTGRSGATGSRTADSKSTKHYKSLKHVDDVFSDQPVAPKDNTLVCEDGNDTTLVPDSMSPQFKMPVRKTRKPAASPPAQFAPKLPPVPNKPTVKAKQPLPLSSEDLSDPLVPEPIATKSSRAPPAQPVERPQVPTSPAREACQDLQPRKKAHGKVVYVVPALSDLDHDVQFVEADFGATSTPKRPALNVRSSALKRDPELIDSERSMKKIRFSEPPRPGRPQVSAAQVQVQDLLSQFADHVANRYVERLQKPNKRVAAMDRRIKSSIAATASKWLKESQAHLEAIKEGHKSITGMYTDLLNGSTPLVEHCKEVHKKVRYVRKSKLGKNAPTLPASLFSS